ncbi:MAG: TRAP transporter substrate-binding protein [Dehalococcoidia bacterium]
MRVKLAILVSVCLLVLAALPLVTACTPTEETGEETAAPTETEAAPEVIELGFSGLFPDAHPHGVTNQKFCDVINERTDGRVEITFYGSSLVSGPKMYQGTVQGITDMAMTCPLYVSGRFPASELFELPREVPNAWVNGQVYDDFYRHFEPEEFDDTHVLYMHGPGHAVFQSNVKVSKPEDLKGMVIRSSGTSAEVVKAWGGTPRAMEMGEAYEALSKGVVDANFAYLDTLHGWKHAEVVDYVTKLPVSASSCQCVVMNKDKWNSLPADIQEIFTETSEEFRDLQAMTWVYLDHLGLEYFQGLEGREYIEIPEEERPLWEEPLQPVLENYIEEKTAMGLPAEEYMEYVEERTEYHIANQPTEEECIETVESEILNK